MHTYIVYTYIYVSIESVFYLAGMLNMRSGFISLQLHLVVNEIKVALSDSQLNNLKYFTQMNVDSSIVISEPRLGSSEFDSDALTM